MLYFLRVWNTVPLQLCNDTVILHCSKLWAQKSHTGYKPSPCLQLAPCDTNQGLQSADTAAHSHITNFTALISPSLLLFLLFSLSFSSCLPFSCPFTLIICSLSLCCYSLMLLDNVINRVRRGHKISAYFLTLLFDLSRLPQLRRLLDDWSGEVLSIPWQFVLCQP